MPKEVPKANLNTVGEDGVFRHVFAALCFYELKMTNI
jgi:hypothetical protein